ncbi:MAG: hypothetical protein WBY44_27380 [Bryobacteraceae bacterium]
MLTAAQKSRCRELAAALDRGDRATYRRAEDSLTPEMRGEIWDQRAHVVAAGGRAAKAGAVLSTADKTPRPARIETSLRDLDYWADENDDDGDDEDLPPVLPVSKPDPEERQKTKLCDNCRGLGLTSDGVRCTRCNGSGRVSRDDVDDGDDDDRDREDDDDDE